MSTKKSAKTGQAQVNCELNCTGMYKKINNWWICRLVLKLHVALIFHEVFRTSPHLLKITETLFILVCLHSKHLTEQHHCEMDLSKKKKKKKLALQHFMSKGILDAKEVKNIDGKTAVLEPMYLAYRYVCFPSHLYLPC